MTGAGAGAVRVAAVDCGTNSIRLLVADIDPDTGACADVARRMEIVRLGQGVDATGRLAPESVARTLEALRGYAAIISESGATAVRMVATSAARDAKNAADFVRGVREVLGADPEVLSGDQEARLSFAGATAELAGDPPAPYLVADIGGGSTEFVLGDGRPPGAGGPGEVSSGDGAPALATPEVAALSVDIGCVRLTERHLRGDPPLAPEVAAATADIDAALDTVASRVPVTRARSLVGLAGSVTTVAALALGLPVYDAARIHHSRITATQAATQARRLLGMTHAERASLSVMHPGRVDVIGAGALVLERIMTRLGFAEVVVSEHDILDGLAWSLAAGPAR